MKGSIRALIGFLMVFGAVGGMDDPTKSHYFLEQLIVAVAGLALMAWGVRAMNRDQLN